MNMKKSEIVDIYWSEYLKWCANMPDNNNELLLWLKFNDPKEDNFWKYVVFVKKGKLTNLQNET